MEAKTIRNVIESSELSDDFKCEILSLSEVELELTVRYIRNAFYDFVKAFQNVAEAISKKPPLPPRPEK